VRKHIILLFLFCFSYSFVSSQIRNYNLEVSCQSRVYNSTHSILRFKWLATTAVDTQRVYRKLKEDYFWGPQYKIIRDSATTFSDTVLTGSSYEYKFEKDFGPDNWPIMGVIHAGHKVPATVFRGKILMIADSAHKAFLDTALRTFRNDLTGDGWLTELKWFDSATSVPAIKSYIVGRYNADTANVKSVVLIGNLAVPYSGDFSALGDPPPDGHTTFSGPSHEGAWAADCYYGDMDNPTWPDINVTNTAGARWLNHNVPNDGKFDYSFIPSFLKLQVGRIDLSAMPAFSLSERQLLKQYFTKDHNFRHKLVSIRERCLLDDNYGIFPNPPYFSEHFGGNAYRNMAPLISDNVTSVGDYMPDLKTNDYLWSFGIGPGSFNYNSISGVTNTDSLAANTVKSVFSGFTASYMGDWDTTNNFMRAPLAAKGNVLNTFNMGRPQWFFHHMGLGETIGYSTLRTQNNVDTQLNYFLYGASYYTGSVHIALMGDPTVRMQPLLTATNILAKQDSCNNRVNITWNQSNDTAVHNYYILRASHIDSAFTLLDTTYRLFYTDSFPLINSNVYMVRAEKLQKSGSGTYYNLSQGIFDTVVLSIPLVNAGKDTSICRLQKVTLGVNTTNNSSVIYNWSPGGFTTNTVTVQANTPGNRILMVTDTASGCIRRDTMVIVINALPMAETISPLSNSCSDSVVWSSSLNNGTGFNYSWNFTGATTYNTSGNALDSPGLVIYDNPGSYMTRLSVINTITLCSHTDSQLTAVTCVSLPYQESNINCINTMNGKQVSFAVYDRDKYVSYDIEGLVSGQWQLIKSFKVQQQVYFITTIDGQVDYEEIRIMANQRTGEKRELDHCIWKTMENELNMYPNPVQEQLFINFTGDQGNKISHIDIYNMMGAQIFTGDFMFTQNLYMVPSSEFASGVYVVKVSMGEKNWSYKFIKE
jgi:hypothetical protein